LQKTTEGGRFEEGPAGRRPTSKGSSPFMKTRQKTQTKTGQKRFARKTGEDLQLPGKQVATFISINLKPLKPAIQLPKKMVLSYVFQVSFFWTKFPAPNENISAKNFLLCFCFGFKIHFLGEQTP